MIADIANAVAALVPQASPASALSVVRIETTRPVFLVFSADPSKPDYAVHAGSPADARRIHDALTALYPLVGDLVPQPVAVSARYGDVQLQIERGVGGLPWFTIAQRFGSAPDRQALRARALDALQQLHAGCERVPEWRRPVSPAHEIRNQLHNCRERGIDLSLSVRRCADAAMTQLSPLSRMTWPWQHGDFCLNNLLFQFRSAAIIDFEEFATTAVPLHDEFGLALSVNDLIPIPGRSLQDDVRQCLEPPLVEHPELRPFTHALLVHHLLWRINLCDQPNRRGIQRKLLAQLEQLAADSLVPALAWR